MQYRIGSRIHTEDARNTALESSCKSAGTIWSQARLAFERRVSEDPKPSGRTTNAPFRHYCFSQLPLNQPWDNNLGVSLHTNLRTFLKQLEEYGKAHDAQEPEHSRKLLNLEADTAELVSIHHNGEWPRAS